MSPLTLFTFILGAVIVSAVEECPMICPDIYAPVCATKGMEFKQFASECELDFANCQLQRSGSDEVFVQCEQLLCNLSEELFEEPKVVKEPVYEYINPECSRACPLIYLPVCATNGEELRSFGNKCMFESQNCISNNAWKMARSGEC